jgi:hypothetical protein
MDFFPTAERMEGFKILWEEIHRLALRFKIFLENPGASLWISVQEHRKWNV